MKYLTFRLALIASVFTIVLAAACGSDGSGEDEAPDERPASSDGGTTKRDGGLSTGDAPARESDAMVMAHAHARYTDLGTQYEAYPVVLLRDGSLCNDIDFLIQPDDAATHRQKNPKQWTRWRKEGSEYQIEENGKWVKIRYGGKSLPPQPRGETLEGSYQSNAGSFYDMSGGAIRRRFFTFTKAGRFTQSGSVVGTVRDTRTFVIIASTPADGRGTYEVDGYKLHLRYDSGLDVLTTLVPDGKSIYVGGVSYDKP